MRPLLLTALGRPLAAAPLGRRGDDVEVRRVPALPVAPRSISSGRPCSLLDRALLAARVTARRRSCARSPASSPSSASAIPARREPRRRLPADLLTSFVPGDAPPGLLVAVPRRLPPRRGAGRACAARANATVERDARAGGAHARSASRSPPSATSAAAGPDPHAGAAHHRERRRLALPRGARRRAARRATCASSSRRTTRCPTCPSRRTRCRSTTPASRATRRPPASRSSSPTCTCCPTDVALPPEPQLRRDVRLPHQVDARDPDEDPPRRGHRRAAAHQPQARPDARLLDDDEVRARGASRSTRAAWSSRPRSRRRRPSRSRTAGCTRTSSGCSRASSPRPSRRSSRATRRRPATPGASPSMTVGLAEAVDARRQRPVPRRHASRASSCASCATRGCCTTSARSACASRCS